MNIYRVCGLFQLSEWISEECLGYKPFLTEMSADITNLHLLYKRLIPEASSRSRHDSRLNSTASTDSNGSDTDNKQATLPSSNDDTENTGLSQSESCVIS